jgi:hypothetical protein
MPMSEMMMNTTCAAARRHDTHETVASATAAARTLLQSMPSSTGLLRSIAGTIAAQDSGAVAPPRAHGTTLAGVREGQQQQ